jgi:hypothetical protein
MRLQGLMAVSNHGDTEREPRYYEWVTWRNPFRWCSLVVLAGVLAVTACGGSSAASPPAVQDVKFTMTAQNGSGVSGTGQIVQANGSFTVTIKLTGMAPGSSHISHIHAGKCAAPGGIAYALQQVVADSSGGATATTIIPVQYAIPVSGWYVNVHHGPDFTNVGNAPSDSCGDLSAT